MTTPRCEDCRFWEHCDDHGDYLDGWCHRYPPKPQYDRETWQPLVRHDDWCGEFQAKARTTDLHERLGNRQEDS